MTILYAVCHNCLPVNYPVFPPLMTILFAVWHNCLPVNDPVFPPLMTILFAVVIIVSPLTALLALQSILTPSCPVTVQSILTQSCPVTVCTVYINPILLLYVQSILTQYCYCMYSLY